MLSLDSGLILLPTMSFFTAGCSCLTAEPSLLLEMAVGTVEVIFAVLDVEKVGTEKSSNFGATGSDTIFPPEFGSLIADGFDEVGFLGYLDAGEVLSESSGHSGPQISTISWFLSAYSPFFNKPFLSATRSSVHLGSFCVPLLGLSDAVFFTLEALVLLKMVEYDDLTFFEAPTEVFLLPVDS